MPLGSKSVVLVSGILSKGATSNGVTLFNLTVCVCIFRFLIV